jgi:hypothetical protein
MTSCLLPYTCFIVYEQWGLKIHGLRLHGALHLCEPSLRLPQLRLLLGL